MVRVILFLSVFGIISFNWSTCIKPDKWDVMYLCIKGIDFASFWDFILDLFRQCVLFYFILFLHLWKNHFALIEMYLRIHILVLFNVLQIGQKRYYYSMTNFMHILRSVWSMCIVHWCTKSFWKYSAKSALFI